VIVRLVGGLGNQMFQYAFGRSVAARRGEGLCFTRDGADSDHKRCYMLGAFDIPIEFTAGFGPDGREGRGVYHEDPFSFNPQVYTVPDGMAFDGYWQTERYYDDPPLVRSWFSTCRSPSEASRRAADEIAAAGRGSAFLHVRRTDYLRQAEYHRNLWDTGYYPPAMALVRERIEDARFFVFSDDPKWCGGALPGLRVVSHNRPGGKLFGSDMPGREHEDLWLMSLCRHAVIANSSFSWWGAWLGDWEADRTVVAPAAWMGPMARLDTRDIVPRRWLRC
jgi:hypothetical protein